MSVTLIIHIIDIIAVGVFAISGALAAAEKNLDILAFILLAIVTGIGGGTVRDVILNVEAVFWVENSVYLAVCIGAAVFTYIAARFLASQQKTLLWMDAAGLSLFCVLGCAKTWTLTQDPLISVSLGVATATFGSVIRDVLLNVKPVLFGPEIYVSCALLGSVFFVVLIGVGMAQLPSIIVSSVAAFSLRAAAIIFDLRLPKYKND